MTPPPVKGASPLHSSSRRPSRTSGPVGGDGREKINLGAVGVSDDDDDDKKNNDTGEHPPRGYVGVTLLPSGRYRARVKDQSLGTFHTAEAAALAHDRAAIALGTSSPKARLNFPPAADGKVRVTAPLVSTTEQAARRPLPSTPEPPSSTAPSAPRGGVGCAWQALLALIFLALALVAAPPGGGGGGGGESALRGDSSSSPSASSSFSWAERQPSCAAMAVDADVASLAPQQWEETAAVFMDAVREAAGVGAFAGEEGGAGLTVSGAGKGPVLMLVADDPGEARRRASDVAEAFGACQLAKCVLTVDCDAAAAGAAAGPDVELAPAAAGQEARGALQKTLVSFLARCPRGLVILRGAESLTPPLISTLIPSLSEGGRYMRDGKQVRADLATYVITAALEGAGAAAGAGAGVSERTFARLAKDALAHRYIYGRGSAGSSGSGSGEGVALSATSEDADGAAGAFRRRIDFVAPFRV